MMRRAVQCIGGLGAILFLFGLGAAPVFAAGSQCCVYQPADEAPQWLLDLDKGSGATIFIKAKTPDTCPALSSVVAIDQYVGKGYYMSAADTGMLLSTKNDCTTDKSLSLVNSALTTNANTQCCIVMEGNTPYACVDKKKGGTANCLEAAHSSLDPARSIVRSDQTCATLDPCKALAAAKSAGTAPAANPAATATTNALGEKIQPWTQDECLSIKDKNGNQRNWWIPPKDNPTIKTGNYCFVKPITTQLEVTLGNEATVAHSIPGYINSAYKYAMGIAVLAAVLMIMYGGFVWMLSGVASQISEAKAMMTAAATGLVLIFGAYTLLNTINPELTKLRTPPIHAIRPEKFEVAGPQDTACDPSAEDSCKKLGTNFRCQPTIHGVEKTCDKNMQIMAGSVFGAAAITAAAPFAIAAAGTAISNFGANIASQGFGQIAKKMALEAVKEAVKGKAADEIGDKVGQAIAPAVLMAGGAIYAAIPKDPEALGYCVQMNHDKVSGEVCAHDAECQSSKCLLTSSGACGLEKFGVCVNGDLRDACALADNKNADAKKYGCNGGVTCVDNGHGPSKAKMGIGYCSDGSDVGMPCNDKVKCSSIKTPLECVSGYCRQKGYFDEQGVLIKSSGAGQPLCLLPSDCESYGYNSYKQLDKAQGTKYAGCLKSANDELGLPARFLVPIINFKPGTTFFREITTYGTCVVARPTFNDGTKNPTTNFCYVNVYNHGNSVSDEAKKVVSTINSSFSSSKISNDFSKPLFQKVGCGLNSKDMIVKYGLQYSDGVIEGKGGDCVVDAGYALEANLKVVNGIGVMKGYCTPPSTGPNGEKNVWTEKKSDGQLLLRVHEDDTTYGWVKTPDLTELEYTFAGSVE